MLILLAFVFDAFVTLEMGVCIRLLWGWFMVPLFGLPVLSLAGAIGVGCVGTVLASQYIPNKQLNAEMVVSQLVKPLLVLATGAIAHLFL